jgi:hypothetical protein
MGDCRRRNLAWGLSAICALTFFLAVLVSNPCHAQDLAVPSCADHPDPPTDTVVVPGFPAQRLYIYRKSPLLCTDTGAGSCVPSAYVVAGDQLLAGTDCDGWTYVVYKSAQATSGWVTSSALGDEMNSMRPPAALFGLKATNLNAQKDGAGTALNANADTSKAPGKGGPACQAAQQLLNAYLMHPNPGPLGPLPTALQGRTPTQHLPSGDGTEWSGDAWSVQIEGQHLTAVTYHSGGSCSNQFLELWNSNLTHRYPIAGSNADGNSDDRGYSSEDIVTLAGHPYFVHYSRALAVTLSNFTSALGSSEICAISQAPVPMQATSTNRDPSLSNAILHGDISGAPIYDIKPYDVSPESFGFGKQGGDSLSGRQLTIVARGQLDITNDGSVQYVGILSFDDGFSSAGCGHDGDVWVPIELNGDGMPKPGSQFNMKMIEQAKPGEDVRLFAYKGKTYLETRTRSDADDVPNDTVWQLSAQGRQMLITFIPVRYEITSQ